MKLLVAFSLSIFLLGCKESEERHLHAELNADKQTAKTMLKTKEDTGTHFSGSQAKENLVFIKNQYLKMISAVDSGTDLKLADTCDRPEAICFPRALEHNQIYMEKLTKWTNGFYPGLLWKILSAKREIKGFTEAQQSQIFEKATFYQTALLPETKRGSTHDLGFLLYDSFGEALDYADLPLATRKLYEQALQTGRETLATRFDPQYGLIRSWDWKPKSLIHYREKGQVKGEKVFVSNPWQFPVIVDNMMNLEFLFESSDPAHRELAFSHAKQTYLNHYFYANDDVAKEFPIAYHVYEYGSKKPGNWQGLGNVSAWARGQGWSLYGFVNVLEALKKETPEIELPDFDSHVERLVASIDKLLGDDVVPHWDYFAIEENAASIAANQSTSTYRFSRILDLCDFLIDDYILPYIGYGPIFIDKDIYSENALRLMEGKMSAYDEELIQGDLVKPCGSGRFKALGTHIPKDTSAAALYASALYRLALYTVELDVKSKAIALADKIMAELTANYLTSKHNSIDFKLGFVLTEATGNLPNASEIDTSIVYADFYFLEANILKLKLRSKL